MHLVDSINAYFFLWIIFILWFLFFGRFTSFPSRISIISGFLQLVIFILKNLLYNWKNFYFIEKFEIKKKKKRYHILVYRLLWLLLIIKKKKNLCQIGENHSEICTLIRSGSIIDFITYYIQKNFIWIRCILNRIILMEMIKRLKNYLRPKLLKLKKKNINIFFWKIQFLQYKKYIYIILIYYIVIYILFL